MDGPLAQQDYMRLLNLQSIHTFTVSNHRNKLKERLRASAQSFRKERDLLSAAASSCSASSSSTDLEPTHNELPLNEKDSSRSDHPNSVSPTEGSLQSFITNGDLKSSKYLSVKDYLPVRKKRRLNGYHSESKPSQRHSLLLRRDKEGEIDPQDLENWKRHIQFLVRISCRRAAEERNFLPPELRGQVLCRNHTIIGKSTRPDSSSSSTKSSSDELEPDKHSSLTSSHLAEPRKESPSFLNVSEIVTKGFVNKQPKVIIKNIFHETELSERVRHQLQCQLPAPLAEEMTVGGAQHDAQNSNEQEIVDLGLTNKGIGKNYSDYPIPRVPRRRMIFLRHKLVRHEKKGFNNGFKDRDSIAQSHEELLNLCVTEKKNLPRRERTQNHLERKVQLCFNHGKLTVSENGKSLLTNGSLSPTDKENIHKEEKSKTKGVLKRQSIIQTRQGLKRQAMDCETRDISSVVSNHIEGIQRKMSDSVDIEESLLFIKSATSPTQTPTLIETIESVSNESDQIKFGRDKSVKSFDPSLGENENFGSEEILHSEIDATLSDDPLGSNSSCSTVKQVLETKCYRRNGKRICYPDELAKTSEAFSVKNMIQPGIPSFTPQELRDRQLMNAIKVFTSPRHVPIMPDVLNLMTRFNNSCHEIVKNEPWHTAEIVRAINKYAQLASGMAGQLPVASKVNYKAKGNDKDLADSTHDRLEPSHRRTFQNSDDNNEEPIEYIAPRQSLQRKAKDDAAIKEQQAKEKLQTRRPADPNLSLLMLAAETASMASSSSSNLSRATSTARDDFSSEHESEILYRCQVCREEFVNVIDLSVHRYEKHRNCTKCEARFNHDRKRSLVQQELCVPCFKSIPKVDDFEESNKCFQATFEVLKSAQKLFEGTDVLQDCIICPKKFENIAKMKKHLLSQHSDLLHTIDLNRLALLSAK